MEGGREGRRRPGQLVLVGEGRGVGRGRGFDAIKDGKGKGTWLHDNRMTIHVG